MHNLWLYLFMPLNAINNNNKKKKPLLLTSVKNTDVLGRVTLEAAVSISFSTLVLIPNISMYPFEQNNEFFNFII